MSFSTILLCIVIILLGLYSLVLLDLNKLVVHLDLLFWELELELGYILLTSTLLAIFFTLLLETIFFSSKRKNKNEQD
tara:strand:- start:306 stop:539 length:234 start_codon:yes stop_codon:yes gene_type:complete